MLSVIVPAYNATRYLAAAIESIYRQAYEPLEIIVVDDGSTDGTCELASSLPGVRCITQSNAGPAASRNTGIQASCGEIVGFLDADDLWADGKIESQVHVLTQDPTIQLVSGRVEEFYAADVPRQENREARRDGNRAYTVGALLVRRAELLRVGLFDENLRFGEFMDWRSRALNHGLKELVLDRVVLHRRIHESNTTRLAQNHRTHYLAAVRAHLQRIRAQKEGSGHDVQ